jgi:hypothetical protein
MTFKYRQYDIFYRQWSAVSHAKAPTSAKQPPHMGLRARQFWPPFGSASRTRRPLQNIDVTMANGKNTINEQPSHISARCVLGDCALASPLSAPSPDGPPARVPAPETRCLLSPTFGLVARLEHNKAYARRYFSRVWVVLMRIGNQGYFDSKTYMESICPHQYLCLVGSASKGKRCKIGRHSSM